MAQSTLRALSGSLVPNQQQNKRGRCKEVAFLDIGQNTNAILTQDYFVKGIRAEVKTALANGTVANINGIFEPKNKHMVVGLKADYKDKSRGGYAASGNILIDNDSVDSVHACVDIPDLVTPGLKLVVGATAPVSSQLAPLLPISSKKDKNHSTLGYLAAEFRRGGFFHRSCVVAPAGHTAADVSYTFEPTFDWLGKCSSKLKAKCAAMAPVLTVGAEVKKGLRHARAQQNLTMRGPQEPREDPTSLALAAQMCLGSGRTLSARLAWDTANLSKSSNKQNDASCKGYLCSIISPAKMLSLGYAFSINKTDIGITAIAPAACLCPGHGWKATTGRRFLRVGAKYSMDNGARLGANFDTNGGVSSVISVPITKKLRANIAAACNVSQIISSKPSHSFSSNLSSIKPEIGLNLFFEI